MSHRQHLVYKLIGNKLYFMYFNNRVAVKSALFGLATLFTAPIVLLIAEKLF